MPCGLAGMRTYVQCRAIREVGPHDVHIQCGPKQNRDAICSNPASGQLDNSSGCG